MHQAFEKIIDQIQVFDVSERVWLENGRFNVDLFGEKTGYTESLKIDREDNL